MTTTHVVLIVLGALALLYAAFGLPRRKRVAPMSSQAQTGQPAQHGEPAPESGLTAVQWADLSEVHAALARGEMVPAVKAYREATGASLLDAKRAVDRLIEGGPATAGKP